MQNVTVPKLVDELSLSWCLPKQSVALVARRMQEAGQLPKAAGPGHSSPPAHPYHAAALILGVAGSVALGDEAIKAPGVVNEFGNLPFVSSSNVFLKPNQYSTKRVEDGHAAYQVWKNHTPLTVLGEHIAGAGKPEQVVDIASVHLNWGDGFRQLVLMLQAAGFQAANQAEVRFESREKDPVVVGYGGLSMSCANKGTWFGGGIFHRIGELYREPVRWSAELGVGK